jgi:hypothetical protein
VNAVGPIGVASRALAGVALIVLPIVGHGLAVWDVIGALAVLPAISVAVHRLLTAAVARLALSTARLGSSSAGTWMVNLSAVVAILAIGTVLTYLTPIDAGAIWLFFGFSLLVVGDVASVVVSCRFGGPTPSFGGPVAANHLAPSRRAPTMPSRERRRPAAGVPRPAVPRCGQRGRAGSIRTTRREASTLHSVTVRVSPWAERPDLAERGPSSETVWPEYNLHGRGLR